jgi:hypothetical protein
MYANRGWEGRAETEGGGGAGAWALSLLDCCRRRRRELISHCGLPSTCMTSRPRSDSLDQTGGEQHGEDGDGDGVGSKCQVSV